MAFIRTKWVKGRPYQVEVESYREGGKVRQRIIRSLGPLTAEHEGGTRLGRLCGYKTKRGADRGAGLALTILFRTIGEELLDRGPRTVDELISPVEKTLGKPERVNWLYPEAGKMGEMGRGDGSVPAGYTGLITDALEQLEEMHLVERVGDRWGLTKLMRSMVGGTLITAIPAMPGYSKAHRFVLRNKADREALNQSDNLNRDVVGMCNIIRQQGDLPLLKRLLDGDPEVVERVQAFLADNRV